MPHPHVNSPAYAPPVLRPPSPASSLGTSYSPAGDTSHELDLSDGEFDREIQGRLRLGQEFVREWWRDTATQRSEEDLGLDESFRIEDKEKEGWGQDPLIAFGLGPRTDAENNSAPLYSSTLLRILSYRSHPRTNPPFPPVPHPPHTRRRALRTNTPPRLASSIHSTRT